MKNVEVVGLKILSTKKTGLQNHNVRRNQRNQKRSLNQAAIAEEGLQNCKLHKVVL